ncbi:hypothetical protein AB0D86_47780 [Streptomyces sp. NPDC048324]|uniref:hypothetical protein n=1 Tax=Streptomyces sp. NPDC048324 TaxID=3157205 RepID=UPI0034150BB6
MTTRQEFEDWLRPVPEHLKNQRYSPTPMVLWSAGAKQHFRFPEIASPPNAAFASVTAAENGVRIVHYEDDTPSPGGRYPRSNELVGVVVAGRDALNAIDTMQLDQVAAGAFVLPRSARWREALWTSLIGTWSDSLWRTGFLPLSALDELKAQTRAAHRQLTPIWRRRTKHGRVLSLDADLGDGLSLHDLVATDVDVLAHTAGGVFEDERLNAVLRDLDTAERAVVFAYAEGEGTTWAEAAAAAGATDPAAFGERVRRKVKRIAAEHKRRLTQRQKGLA